MPVPSAPAPPDDVPVAISVPAEDEAMKTDREYPLLYQAKQLGKRKCPIVEFQNGNRLSIMIAEYIVGLITQNPQPLPQLFSLELSTYSLSAPFQAQEPPPTAISEDQVASSSSSTSNALSSHIQ